MKQIIFNKIPPDSKYKLKGTSILIYTIALIIVIFALSTCEKPERVVKLTTLDALSADISFNSAVLKGEIIDMGSAPIENYGILISENSTPGIGNAQKKSLGKLSSKGSFRVTADNLIANITYYFRAFVNVNGEDIFADEIRSFKTKAFDLATVTTTSISSITSSSASSGGNVTADGGALVTARGVCWNTSTSPTVANSKTTDGSGSGIFTSNLTGLTANTKYYVRAYATNSAGTTYGLDVSFTTNIMVVVPTITTTTISAIGTTTATSGGNVTNDGGASITVHGVCWSSVSNPTIADSKTTDGTGVGTFASSITGLTPGTIYHVRAYATNSVGTAYGNEISFTTLQPPSSITTAATAVGSTSATFNGTVNANNSSTTVSFEYGLSTSYGTTVPAAQSTINGSTATSVSANIAGLSQGTTYHFRVIASSAGGTDNGSDFTFNTFVDLPTLTTLTISLIRASTAFSGGNITFDGGGPISTRGICWSSAPNPTILDNKTDNGVGTGIYTSTLSGLTPNTKYFVRAYATNSAGTNYGNQQYFTTDPSFVTDGDGNLYNLIYIGSQVWLKENLKTTRYNDGTLIPNIKDATQWSALTTPGYCWYNNDSITNKVFGSLYNWYAVSTGKICPAGWHVPSDDEWTTLTIYLGGDVVAGGKLKEVGTTYWDSPNNGATNETGFSALGGGDRDGYGVFHQKGTWAVWFTSTEFSPYAWYRLISNNSTNVQRNNGVKTAGPSIRCIRDY